MDTTSRGKRLVREKEGKKKEQGREQLLLSGWARKKIWLIIQGRLMASIKMRVIKRNRARKKEKQQHQGRDSMDTNKTTAVCFCKEVNVNMSPAETSAGRR